MSEKDKNQEPQTNRELTYGERRVKVSFNPSQDPLVAEIKQKTAEIIDLLEKRKQGPDMLSGDAAREIATAQTHYQTASMYAVSSVFS